MPNKIKCLVSATFGIAALAFGLTVAAQAPPDADPPAEEAQPARTIVWLLDAGNVAGDTAKALADKTPKILGQIVEESGETHVVAVKPADLARHLAKAPRPTPGCLQGLSPCKNPLAVVMEGLGADLLIRGKLKNAGPRWTLEVEMFGPTGDPVLSRTITAGGVPLTGDPVGPEEGLEQLAFKAVRELFQSTGSLEITSIPEGAEVSIGGKPRGQTPLVVELPIGTHEIKVSLDNHSEFVETARVAARKRTRVEANLNAQLATITVDSTPVLGEVFIDNKPMGMAGTPFQLPAGEYELEIRSEGFKTRTQRLIITPEEQKIVSLTLEQKRPELHIPALGEVSTEAIMARNFYARVAYRFTNLSTGLSEGEGQLGDSLVRTGGLNSADAQGRRDFGFHGIHLDLGHNWEHFGLVGLGLSIYSSSDRAEGELKPSGVNSVPLAGVEFDDFTRLELRPAQVTFRYPYKNLFPAVQTGFGYYSNTFVADAGDSGRTDMEQDGFFWNFSIEMSYFFDTWWYGFTSLGVQKDLSHDDTGTQMLLSFGVGATFENPFNQLGRSEPPREAD